MNRLAERAARRGYAALLSLLRPAYVLRLWRRGRAEPLYRHAIGERLGLYAGPVPAGPLLWLHAVSLGETHAAAPLVRALRGARPGLRLLLTHGTATGRAAGAALLDPAHDLQAWLPFDTRGAVRRFFAHYRPALGVLMETEVWPNLLHAADEAGVPMVLANARLSAKSERTGRRLAAVMHPAVRSLALVLAQGESDAERLVASGARAVEVCGNLKFDLAPDEALLARGRAWRTASQRRVVLAASTREGEEALLLAAWQASGGARRARLLIVPRHPQRFDEVARLVEHSGLKLARRSAWRDGPEGAGALDADVWLGDSMGEMPLYYALAEVALLGGSFERFGGQNLIEAAACGCPVLMGPHTWNFAEAAELAIAAGAAAREAGLDAAVQRALGLLGTPEGRAMGAAGLAFAARHRGAAARMAERILALMPSGKAGSA